jgi:saccharopine dehydrogenase-like NADP-dependent oxidoreductase
MGLDPGIDHMSAMEIIDRLKRKNASILSFTSHCGGLVAPESDDNPWHYKISWNAANVVRAGTAGAVFKENGEIRSLGYDKLFEKCREVEVPSAGNYAYYPNRDSLSYTSVYGLENTGTFLRTTLRHPAFCSGWNCIVKAGLASDDFLPDEHSLTFQQWSAPLLPHVHAGNRKQFEYLGFFDNQYIPPHLNTSAAVLQYLVEKHLMLRDNDKDMVIMLHEFIYEITSGKEKLTSALVVKGEDNFNTAMAKTVGLPLGIAAKLVMQDKITLTGLHIPVMKEIYEPVLRELSTHSVNFTERIETIG